MKAQFKDFKVVDIDGKESEQEIYKVIANIIFNSTKDVDLASIAMDINQGKEVELRESDLVEIKKLIPGKLVAFAERQFLQFLDGIEKKK